MNTVQKVIVVLGIVALAFVIFINPATYEIASPTVGNSIFSLGVEKHINASVTGLWALGIIALTIGLTWLAHKPN